MNSMRFFTTAAFHFYFGVFILGMTAGQFIAGYDYFAAVWMLAAGLLHLNISNVKERLAFYKDYYDQQSEDD